MTEPLSVRSARAADEASWRRLWDAYCEFYETEVPQPTTDATWARIVNPGSGVDCLVALDTDGEVIGFANYLLHQRTWSEQPACYLEDLYVTPTRRGLGAGRSLIERVEQLRVQNGWSLLYWLTQDTNMTARALYDRFGPADGYVRYSLPPATG